MSQFEFMRSIPIGQYLPLGSALHKMDPRARMAAYFLVVMALTFSRRIEGIALGVVVIILGLWIARIPLLFTLRGLVTPLPFLVILAVLQVFLNVGPAGETVLLAWGPLQISQSDLLAGLILLVRFAGLILVIGLATFTLSTSEMTQGLNQLFRPLTNVGIQAQDLVMMVQVTLRFLPMLAQSAERIAKAQASRGADWDNRKGNILVRIRQVTPVIIPLFLASLHRAENMALAMDARAYGSAPERTSLVELHFHPKDALLVVVGLAVAAMILFI
jgi:energy-coupling factor transport system permease protein